MKKIITLLLLACMVWSLPAQDTLKHFLFLPHPRSNDSQHQSVQAGIEQIDFSLYDMLFLGGDLTYTTTIDYPTLDYCDELFDLGNPTTLWTLGNHDMTHPEFVPEYTGRPAFYAYNMFNITFAVLCTELDVNGFVYSHISGEQLDMLQHIADTISCSEYLVLLQHRLLWMIGNEDLEEHLDSVGQSTAQLDTSNFYQVVYPLLQQVKAKGIQVICLGGDRADINIEYSPEAGITYLASVMVPEFPETQNHVIILTLDEQADSIGWKFVSLADVEKNPVDTSMVLHNPGPEVPRIFYDPSESSIVISEASVHSPFVKVSMYETTGRCLLSDNIVLTGAPCMIHWNRKGIFFIRIEDDTSSVTQKIMIR